MKKVEKSVAFVTPGEFVRWIDLDRPLKALQGLIKSAQTDESAAFVVPGFGI